ncbi:AsmA-like C-terminal region-containing protein [Accumulibacter sp.]|uniref:AsmA-like C-terminal region-containing protein n=1 Tax=Accumulibacter sp. TaxID=2053492 RepID=UPI0025FE0704|nr:AsmA-like C-terminal region-containing protein [Accumulibacter sp.]MCM8593994.1 hypothetical protein [Accumulibacter sp.]MCM8624811.1 hypothetical protein [Accumulibacter sp.]MDS4048136.1 AsmA-like C-terminal region-containing protein [Accumulibacter sp.]
MDAETLEPTLVFAKTPAGEEAMVQRTRVVQRNLRMVLILVDGNATVAELCEKTGNPPLTQSALLELETDGFIERRVDKESVWRHVGSSASRPKGSAVKSPADSAPPTGGERPATLAAPPAEGAQVIPFPEARDRKPSLLADGGPLGEATTVGAGFFEPSTGGRSSKAPDSGTPTRPSLTSAGPALAATKDTPPPGVPVPASIPATPVEEPVLLKPIRRGTRRRSVTWPMALLLGIVVLAAVVALLALFFPYSRYLPEVEAALAESTGKMAKIGEMHVQLRPMPGLLLSDVHLGADPGKAELRIDSIRLLPVVSSLSGSRKVFHEAELSGLMLSADGLLDLAAIIDHVTTASLSASVERITLKDASLSFAGLVLGGMHGEVNVSADHRTESLALRSADGSLRVRLMPTPHGVAVRVDGVAWRPVPGSPFVFDSVSIEGEVVGPQLAIDTLDLRIFDGAVSGTTRLSGNGKASLSGDVSFERINLKRLGEALGIGAQFDGEAKGRLRFSASAATWPSIFSQINGSGEFLVHRGSLGAIDLPEAVRRVSTTPATLGGATRFEELSGVINLAPGVYRFSRLVLNAGLMESTGQLEISHDLELNGRMNVQMRGHTDQTATTVVLSGPLKSPLSQAVKH